MTVALNHTIVHAVDKRASAEWFVEIFGRPPPMPFGPFLVVSVDNGVSLDFYDAPEPIDGQHYAFLVGEDDFDVIFGRIRERDVPYYADPAGQQEGEINHHDGGRGVYFAGPEGHWYEIITRPYGG